MDGPALYMPTQVCCPWPLYVPSAYYTETKKMEMIDSGGSKKKQNREKAIILEIWGGGGNEANFSDFQLSSVFIALKYHITLEKRENFTFGIGQYTSNNNIASAFSDDLSYYNPNFSFSVLQKFNAKFFC